MTVTNHWYHRLHWKYFVGWSYFNFINMMINDLIWSTLLSYINLLLFFFITNYPIRKAFFKWSIIIESRISKENENVTSYQFEINQDYKKRMNIWKDINYNLMQSRKYKLCGISFSVIWSRLVHFSVQVPTWWWSKSSRGLIVPKGLCISIIDIVVPVGKYTVNLFVILTTLEFSTNNT